MDIEISRLKEHHNGMLSGKFRALTHCFALSPYARYNRLKRKELRTIKDRNDFHNLWYIKSQPIDNVRFWTSFFQIIF